MGADLVRVGCSGVVRQGTGIGVLQRHLYPRLEAMGVELFFSENRDLGAGAANALHGLLRGLTPAAGKFDAYLSVVPPLPIGVSVPTVSIVHDLRWQETRGRLSRTYRRLDLARTVRSSERIVCISDRTRSDLADAFPASTLKSSVSWLGPGLAEPIDIEHATSEKGIALLVGGASHKKNELAARLIVDCPQLFKSVIGVGVSEETRQIVQSGLPEGRHEWHGRVTDDELRALFRRAEYFLLLGTDEGFGLPYIEALVSGCQVVGIRQTLTEEILGDAAVLLPQGSPREMRDSLLALDQPSLSERVRVAARYDWDIFARSIYTALRESVGEVDVA